MTTSVGLELGTDDGISVAALVGRAVGVTDSVTPVGDAVGILVSAKSPPPSPSTRNLTSKSDCANTLIVIPDSIINPA